MRRLRKLSLFAFIATLLIGCAQTDTQRAPEAADAQARADALLAQGLYPEAAEAYMQLAFASSEPARGEYRLRAADALIEAGEHERARAVTESTALAPESAPDARFLEQIILARIEVAEGNPEAALARLSDPPSPSTHPAYVQRYYQARVAALESLHRLAEAVRERVAAEPYLAPAQIEDNRRAIWNALMAVATVELAQIEVTAPEPYDGWIELALIAKRYITDPGVLESALDEWTARYPSHPGASMLSAIADASQAGALAPKHIALLLPLDGPFGRAALAVRDGFIAAWLEDTDNPERPEVSLWNTAGADIWTLYGSAVAAGADFVVGPLDKPAVNRLAAVSALAVTTLALNHADPPPTNEESSEGSPPSAATEADLAQVTLPDEGEQQAGAAEPEIPSAIYYEFALSPEDEARAVAEHARARGMSSAAILTPEGEWGERVGAAFIEQWRTLGGNLSGHLVYTSDATKMSESVAALLGVDASKQRASELEQFLGVDLEHEPRHRGDIEFIFMAAFPTQARQLEPQIRFHHGEDIPVFSTSHVFAGVADPAADTDLDGITFGDMPWVLVDDGARNPLKARIEQLWPDSHQSFARLYAFGVDAYCVVAELGRLRAQAPTEYAGATGGLSVDDSNRVARRLTWAKFEQGVAVPLDSPSISGE